MLKNPLYGLKMEQNETYSITNKQRDSGIMNRIFYIHIKTRVCQ